MTSSGRATPLAREREPQVHAVQGIGAATTSRLHDLQRTAPQQSSNPNIVESSADTDAIPYREVAPEPTDVLNSASATEYNESAAVASPPRPHIDAAAAAAAAAAADSTTTPVECEDPRNRNNGSCTPATRSWRDWRLVHKLVLWLKGEKELAVVNEAELFAEEDASEYFIRRIRISKVVKDEATGERHEQSASALALFDTGCPGDLLSVEFAKGAWPDLDLDEKPNEVIADQIGSRNNGTVVSVGRIDVAWSSRDNRRGKLSCRARTYRDSFHLVDTADFDVVIGSQSMLRYGLLNLNPRIFGHLKARRVARHEVTREEAARGQALADANRSDAARRRLQAETQSQTNANATTNTTPAGN